MPGIQLIPMADNSGAPADAMGDFNNSLQRAQQMQMQQQQHAAEMLLRQREADEQSQARQRAQAERERQMRAQAIDEVMQHKDNPAMAHMVAQKYGIPLNTIAPQGAESTPLAGAPQATSPLAQGQGTGAPPPAGQSPMSMQSLMAIDPVSPPMDQPTPMTTGGPNTVRVRDPIPIQAGTPSPTPEQEHLNYADQLLRHDSAVSEQGDRVEQFQQAEQAAKNGAVPRAQSPVYELGFPDGPVRIDTGALRAGEEDSKATRLKRFETAFAGNAQAMEMAKQYVHLGMPDDFIAKALLESGKIDQRMEGRLNMLEAGLSGRAENAKELEELRAKNRLALENDKQAAGQYANKTGIGGGGAPGAVGPDGKPVFNRIQEAANRMALKNMQTNSNGWAARYGLPQMTRISIGLQEAIEHLDSNNAPATAAALEKYTALSRSGSGPGVSATNAALLLFQKHLAGIGGTAEGALQKLSNGDLGDEQKANLRRAIVSTQEGIKNGAGVLHQQFVDAYYKSPTYQNLKVQVEDQEESIFGGLGYHARRDPNAKGIEVLSGAPPSVRQGGSVAGGGAERAPVSITPRDQEILRSAKADLADPSVDAETKASAQRAIEHVNEKMRRMTSGQ